MYIYVAITVTEKPLQGSVIIVNKVNILKQCNAVIAPSLCSLFNQSLQTGTLPFEWKSANVTPVHKKNKNGPATGNLPMLHLFTKK